MSMIKIMTMSNIKNQLAKQEMMIARQKLKRIQDHIHQGQFCVNLTQRKDIRVITRVRWNVRENGSHMVKVEGGGCSTRESWHPSKEQSRDAPNMY